MQRPTAAAPERLDRVLRAWRPEWSWGAIRDLIGRGKVAVDGVPVTDAGTTVAGGRVVAIAVGARRPVAATVAPAAAVPPLAEEAIAHADRDVVVVHKPAGLDTVPYADAVDSLQARTARAVGAAVRIVHRLDRDTTGLLVFARHAEAEGRLAHQFRQHTVHRRYLALAHGAVAAATLRSFLVEDRGDGRRGSTPFPGQGKEAVTHVEPVQTLRGATLVACRLETGRTHQIRIHLAEAGHMLLGERAYTRDHRGPVLPAPRILLHAAELGFRHPATGRDLRFAAPLPADFAAVLDALRP